jgi:hypothetical protein
LWVLCDEVTALSALDICVAMARMPSEEEEEEAHELYSPSPSSIPRAATQKNSQKSEVRLLYIKSIYRVLLRIFTGRLRRARAREARRLFCKTFSKVSALVRLLYEVAVKSLFQNPSFKSRTPPYTRHVCIHIYTHTQWRNV